MIGFEDTAEVAKNVAAIAGCIVAVVAVYRMPAVNNVLRRLVRYLFTSPLSSWAQKQVRAVVSPQIAEAAAIQDARQDALAVTVAEHLAESYARQTSLHQESAAWLAESQSRAGEEIHRLADAISANGDRLLEIESRTSQLLPNGGKSMNDRIIRMEKALGTNPPEDED